MDEVVALPLAQTEEVSIVFWLFKFPFHGADGWLVTGRGGFQQSFGPPAQVLGIAPPRYKLSAFNTNRCRNGHIYARYRG